MTRALDLGDLQAAIVALGATAPDWINKQPAFADAVDDVLSHHDAVAAAGHAELASRNGNGPLGDLTRAIDGATFIDQVGDDVPALWGSDGGEMLWAQGEPLMLVGPDGVGKTTLMQQLCLARIGMRGGQLLGLDVRPADRKVLYVAADRPRQAASSFRRMVDTDDPGDREILESRLVVWKGPFPFNFPEDAAGLPTLADHYGASDIFIDSLKDVAVDLSKDEIGSRVARACQTVMAAGLELAISHHQRKEMNGGNKPRRLADVYGSRWITAAMGSVALLWGEPGDPVVELRHLKQPVEEFGPHRVIHDHDLGRSRLHEPVDLTQALWDAGDTGLLVAAAAKLVFGVDSPSPSEVEKARRKLEKLVATGKATKVDDTKAARYFHASIGRA